MSSYLKGNFKTEKEVRPPETKKEADDLESRFERAALKRLGGSIAFVAKKKVKWTLDDKG
ncbi:MAG: hypothetical protein HY521_04885 [Proteobacteria bacterium]|nr:hypothetical protein [Pseudomonadota bacterium]